MDVTIRRATHDDYDDVAAFTRDLWADRGGDYLPDVYHDWIEGDEADDRKTFVADAAGADEDGVVGILQAVVLSPDEAWYQGMRVHPDYRDRGVARRLNEAAFAWSRERGATVGRVMVFSWNDPALGLTRALGHDPVTSFRWAHPAPDSGADPSGVDGGSGGDGYVVESDPDAAWRFWRDSAARDHLRGLALDDAESWALRELTREDLRRAADERAVFAVRGTDGAGADDQPAGDAADSLAGMAVRTRTVDRETDGETETWAEYGVAAWADLPAARSLFAAIARDATDAGADRTRVLIPESVAWVSDAAATGAGVSDHPDFVLERDLTTAD